MLLTIITPDSPRGQSIVFCSHWTVGDAADWMAHKCHLTKTPSATFLTGEGDYLSREQVLGEVARGLGPVELVTEVKPRALRVIRGASRC